MTMPRLSLYRPEKGNDYKFIDKSAWEMFQVGGTDVLVHKYIGSGTPTPGTASPTTPEYTGGDDPFQIQDLLFLENRDRKYDPDIYLLRGVYNISDTDFNLSQFGLFLQNDTVFITFHINDTVEKLGRKIIAGDVIELPHLKDEHALNDLNFALKRFYVIEEVSRAAEGYSVTWYPHLYRAKCKPLVDSQEFKQILDGLADYDSYQGVWDPAVDYKPGDIVSYPDINGIKYTAEQGNINTPPRNQDGTLSDLWKPADSLRDIMSTYDTEMKITQAVLDQAEADAPKSGYDTTSFYTLQVDQDGKPELVNVNQSDLLANRGVYATDVDGNFLFKSPFDPLKKYLVNDEFTYNENWYKVLTASTAEDNPPPPNSSYELLRPVVQDGSIDDDRISVEPNASTINQTAENSGYPGYLVGDGVAPNGAPFTSGITFPAAPVKGQFCLRTDYMPRRLFRFDGGRWVKVEDDVRMTMSNNDTRNTYKSGFVNNSSEKSNFNKKISDTFFVNSAMIYNPPVQTFMLTDIKEGLIITTEDYNSEFGIEAFVNEVQVKVTVSNRNGKMAFVVKTKIKVGDKIEWSLYKQQLDQRQSLSKALRPKADL